MIRYIRSRLGLKLFLTYLLVMLVGTLVLVVVAQFTLPTAYNRYMEGLGMGDTGMGMGRGPGSGNGVGGQNFFSEFRAGFNEALLWSLLGAAVLAIVTSLLMSRSLVAPLRSMMSASQRIAEGNYAGRVDISGPDELGQLGTHFNRMAEKLDQTEAMRRRLIGDVTHELRTPLTTIKGSMEGLMDGVLPQTPETYEQIYKEADRLERLVNDLQELSRVEAGAYRLELKPTRPADLVAAVIKRLGIQFEEKGVVLSAEVPARLPAVMADEDRIGQVLVNLVGNALYYTPEGGGVRIEARQDGNRVGFSVRDTGIGLSPEALRHVFERFYRADPSRSRRPGGGSGIGLTIAQHLVEAHGGLIRAASEGEGKGSTFTFSLPIVESPNEK